MAAEDTVTGLESLPLFDIVRGAAGSPTAGGRRSGGENIGLLTGGVQFIRQDQPAGITALPAAAAAAPTAYAQTPTAYAQTQAVVPTATTAEPATQASNLIIPETVEQMYERIGYRPSLTNPDLTELVGGVPRGKLPEYLRGFTTNQLTDIAKKYGMTLPEFAGYEYYGSAKNDLGKQILEQRQASAQRPFDELLAELQYYKENPPQTYEDVQKANIAFQDYQQRYAQSSWNYPEMGGRPQDYSLQPIRFLPTTFTEHSDPSLRVLTPQGEELPSSYTQFSPKINDLLNSMSQEASAMSNTQIGANRALDKIRTIKETQALIEKYPEISEIINAVYSVDSNFQKFNPLDDVTIKNLASEIKQFGPRVAAAHLINRAKNLVGFGQENWYSQHTMDNPSYAAYERMLRELEPKKSDKDWKEAIDKAYTGNNPKVIGDIWRDPVSGAGFGLTGSRGMQFYNRAGEQAYFGGTHIEDFIEEARRLGMDLTKLDKDTRDRINAAFARTSGGNLADYGFAEGGLARRQFIEDPEFNLGMTPAAFRNLGLMGLPGANTTVANPEVMSQLSEQVLPKTTGFAPDPYKNLSFQLFGAADAPPPTVEDLYKTVLGRASDPEGLQFWSSKLGPTVQKNELEEFYNAALPELAKTGYVPLKATGPTEVAAQYPEGYDMSSLHKTTVPTITVPTIPAADMPPEPKEITDVDFAGAAPAVDTSNFPKFENKPYDPAAYDNIVKQLTAQQQALLQNKGFQYTSTFGGATETIQDMAKRLAAMGISDINDFGMKHELPVEKVYETIEQDEGPSMTFDTGKYRTVVGVKGKTGEGEPIYEYRELTPDEVKKLKFKDDSGVGFLPVDQIKRADLRNSPFAETVYYNKKTGEEINTRQFGGKAESGLFASSGAGDGYTNYRVVYDEEKGTPVFLPEKELSGMKEFVAKDLPGILSVLRFVPGAQIPVMLAQAGAAAYMGAKPEDILKRLATTYLASNIGKIGNKLLPELGFDMPTSDLGKMALKSGYSGLASLIQGGDLEDALKSAGVSAVGSGISGLLPKGGDINYSRLLQAAAPALAKGRLSNADIFRIMTALARGQQTSRGR